MYREELDKVHFLAWAGQEPGSDVMVVISPHRSINRASGGDGTDFLLAGRRANMMIALADLNLQNRIQDTCDVRIR